MTAPRLIPALVGVGALLALIAAGAVLIAGWGDAALWVQAQQQTLYAALQGAIRGLKTEGSAAALLGLIGLSFVYGVLHAAGPGHGKAVISAYLVATGDTVRRGIMLSFLTSFVQGLTAIVLVGGLVLVLGWTARAATAQAAWLEELSYVFILALGLWMLAREAMRIWSAPSVAHGHAHRHGHHQHDHHDDHRHEHHHEHGPDCGHDHALEAEAARKPLTLASTAAVALSVGIRPCMGAILVLVFTLTQGMTAAGISAVAAMSLGTAITVSALAVLTASARGGGLKALIGDSPWYEAAHRLFGVLGALALVLLALLLLSAPQNAAPFGVMPAS